MGVPKQISKWFRRDSGTAQFTPQPTQLALDIEMDRALYPFVSGRVLGIDTHISALQRYVTGLHSPVVWNKECTVNGLEQV